MLNLLRHARPSVATTTFSVVFSVFLQTGFFESSVSYTRPFKENSVGVNGALDSCTC